MTLAAHAAAQGRADPAAVLAKATLSAVGRLGLSQRDLSAVLGASEASVSRLQRGRGIDPASKEGELALLFLRLYRSLDALVGGDDRRAREWLHAENVHLAGVPAERIVRVEGLVDVVQYLDAMRGRL
jgi:transcriptional regulator with XRE-family HTH domain